MPWSWSQSVPCGIPGGFTAAGQGTDQAVMSMGETVDLRKSLGEAASQKIMKGSTSGCDEPGN